MNKIWIIGFTCFFQYLYSQLPKEPLYGWCVYTHEAASEKHLEMLKKCQPSMIRWFVEWDRIDIIKNGKSMRQEKLNFFKPFFEICAKQNIVLVTQIWVKERLWSGDSDGGTQWAKPDKLSNFPKDIEKSYGTFVNDLVNLMVHSGISPQKMILEAWNEPDLLWGVSGNPPNYHETWKIFSKKGFSKWTGGSGEKFQQLHKVLQNTYPNILWASNSVGIHERYHSWIKPTYEIPQIQILDFHYYLWNCKTANEYCDSIGKILERWDKQLPQHQKPFPFFIGECARWSSGTPDKLIISEADAKMMREICQILKKRYPDRFLGMTAHGPINMWQKGFAWYQDNYSP